ncbi:MAG: DUF4249 domain-containing protein [Muribaculaceae bacterium]|nr:DUF4249 domain-containing protein [Muribaculaceae bacterium]
MAILKKIYPLLFLIAIAGGLTSCYTEFDPHIDTPPVLCMNSTITPGEPVTLFLTRTWSWTEGDENKIDVNVKNAEVRMTVNGEYKETLKQAVYSDPAYAYGPYPEQRECYQSKYRPKSGDMIRLEATSTKFGEATAEVTVPAPVPIEKIEAQVLSCQAYGNLNDFPAVADGCQLEMRLNLLAYFTDPSSSTDFYDLDIGYTSYYNHEENTMAGISNYPFIDFSGEPLLKEHLSVLESTIAETYGYTIFSDRQINGHSYPLRIGYDNLSFAYRNPHDQSQPKEAGIEVILRHVDPSYYKHVISVWEGNDGIVGALGGVGLANTIYPYSNVSTGAGLVTAYAAAKLTIPFIELIAIAEEGNFK